MEMEAAHESHQRLPQLEASRHRCALHHLSDQLVHVLISPLGRARPVVSGKRVLVVGPVDRRTVLRKTDHLESLLRNQLAQPGRDSLAVFDLHDHQSRVDDVTAGIEAPFKMRPRYLGKRSL